jgi:hypothetical protein
MADDHGVDQIAPMRLLPHDRPLLVSLDEARVSDHIGHKNGGEPAFHDKLLRSPILAHKDRESYFWRETPGQLAPRAQRAERNVCAREN